MISCCLGCWYLMVFPTCVQFTFFQLLQLYFSLGKCFFLISCSFGGTDNPGTLAWSEKVYQLSFSRSWCSYWTFWAQVVLTFLQNCKLSHVLPLNYFLYQIKFCFLQIKNAKGNKYFLIKKKKLPVYFNFKLTTTYFDWTTYSLDTFLSSLITILDFAVPSLLLFCFLNLKNYFLVFFLTSENEQSLFILKLSIYNHSFNSFWQYARSWKRQKTNQTKTNTPHQNVV